MALVTVETRPPDASRPRESQEDWSREARGVVQRCVLPDLDVLLPKMSADPDGEQIFIAAFADDKGASVLSNRIREQLERLPRLKQPGMRLSVSYSMLPPLPRGVGRSTEDIVTRMAARVEESVKAHIISEGVSHE